MKENALFLSSCRCPQICLLAQARAQYLISRRDRFTLSPSFWCKFGLHPQTTIAKIMCHPTYKTVTGVLGNIVIGFGWCGEWDKRGPYIRAISSSSNLSSQTPEPNVPNPNDYLKLLNFSPTLTRERTHLFLIIRSGWQIKWSSFVYSFLLV